MIVAEKKPIEEIIEGIKGCKKILIAGCNECVTVCEAGGKKEVAVLASALRMYFMNEGKEVQIDEVTLERQCDHEYLEEIRNNIDQYDAVLSLACGVGVQFMAEKYFSKPIYPGVNTCFLGAAEERGIWGERCQACGQCILGKTAGICPVSRCAKRVLNGPCGGSTKGSCELNKELACAWQLIVERLKELDRLDEYEELTPIKDWSTDRAGGPRKVVREDVIQ
jgi:ferredoxin